MRLGLKEMVLLASLATTPSCGIRTKVNPEYDCKKNAVTIVESLGKSGTNLNRIYTTDFPANLPAEFFNCFEQEVYVASNHQLKAVRVRSQRNDRVYYQIVQSLKEYKNKL